METVVKFQELLVDDIGSILRQWSRKLRKEWNMNMWIWTIASSFFKVWGCLGYLQVSCLPERVMTVVVKSFQTLHFRSSGWFFEIQNAPRLYAQWYVLLIQNWRIFMNLLSWKFLGMEGNMDPNWSRIKTEAPWRSKTWGWGNQFWVEKVRLSRPRAGRFCWMGQVATLWKPDVR